MFACWRGEVLAQSTVEVIASQGITGAATVVRPLEHRGIEDAARLLAHKFQLSGFHGLDFILEKGSGAACMIELNPRSTQLGHLNLSSHGDLAGVIASRLGNEAVVSEDRIRDDSIALFPHAFKSNPKSPYLRQGYHDVPWEAPALVRELVRDSWPDRRWLSRIYHYFRARKQLDVRQEIFQPANSNSHT
jgi:hypothetical protein